MHIVIYGVGRSGTKAVQLYLSYLIAQMEEEVWINYEPYFWLARKTKAVDFEGFYHHSHAPHFADSSNQFSKSHNRFLNKLSTHSGSVVTKFIRGNGRIDAINEVFAPDHCIIIVRDLYEVLLSVIKTEWDFWSVGWDYQVSWDAFVEEVKRKNIVENIDWCLARIEDRLDQNAFYWYTMNLTALRSKHKNIHWIAYKQIGKIAELAKHIFNVEVLPEPFRSKKFAGDNLHADYPLQSTETSSIHSHIMNQVLYKTLLFNKYGWFIQPQRTGSLASINKDYFLVEEKNNGTSVVIEKKDLFEFFNEDIKNKFDKVLALEKR
ncbi:hypothetical protein BH11BAC1_BH11BAC1_19920 [soil metagenome]